MTRPPRRDRPIESPTRRRPGGPAAGRRSPGTDPAPHREAGTAGRAPRNTSHGPRVTGHGAAGGATRGPVAVPVPRVPSPGSEGAAEWVVGFHAVLAALEHNAGKVEVVLVAEGAGGGRGRRIVDAARSAGARCHPSQRRQLDEIAGGTAHNGFAARLSPVAFADPAALLGLPGPVCLIGLDTPEDPHNLGAVVRVVAGLGLGGIVVSGPHPPPLGGAVAKVAAGTLPLVRLAHVGSLGDFARQAKDAGFWVVGADAAGEPAPGFELPERLLLCLGAEAGGLRAKTRAALDATIAIPLTAGVESLNLSVATAILAWEWRRGHPLPSAPWLGTRGSGSDKP